MFSHERGVGDVVRGAVAGAIGGCVASWVMNQFQAANTRQEAKAAAAKNVKIRTTKPTRVPPKEKKQGRGDDATVKTAQAVSRRLFERELTPKEKEIAGPLVHYAYGSLAGGLYGAAAEVWPVIAAGFGMPYGIMMFGIGDEIAVPALGLGPGPTSSPPSKHADYLAAHIVYGIALDISRRIARHIV